MHGFSELLPARLIVRVDGFIDVLCAGEENIHRLGEDTASDQPMAKLTQPFAQRQGQPRRLIMLQVVETRIDPGEPQDFVEKETQVHGQFAEQFEFGLLRPDFQLALFLRRRHIHRRLQDEPEVVEHDPRRFHPGRLVGVEVHIAMAVVAQEFLGAQIELWKLGERVLLHEFA